MTLVNTDLKILLFDIETAPALVWTYGLHDQNISIQSIVQDPKMIAFTAKWYGKKKMYAFSEYHQSRQEMLDSMWAFLDEADVVIGWNSRRFDAKWVNSEFAVEGMTPPSPYKHLDLLTETKRSMRFISNKLDYVSKRLLDDKKIDYNILRMWEKVSDPGTTEEERKKEWSAMLRYAKKDTALMEPMFEKLLPWIKMPHPVRSKPGVTSCIACGGEDLRPRGKALTLSGSYERLRCESCGKWQRGKARTDHGATREIS